MITGKQRAFLRKTAINLPAVVSVGKSGVTPEVTASADEALTARELIKVSVLNNCPEDAREAAETLGGRTRSEVVAVVGKKIVLYRKSKEKPIIELPK